MIRRPAGPTAELLTRDDLLRPVFLGAIDLGLIEFGQEFVWVVDLPASTVSMRKVQLTQAGGDRGVIGGLAPGTRVVTAGIHSLTSGQHVRIEQDATP